MSPLGMVTYNTTIVNPQPLSCLMFLLFTCSPHAHNFYHHTGTPSSPLLSSPHFSSPTSALTFCHSHPLHLSLSSPRSSPSFYEAAWAPRLPISVFQVSHHFSKHPKLSQPPPSWGPRPLQLSPARPVTPHFSLALYILHATAQPWLFLGPIIVPPKPGGLLGARDSSSLSYALSGPWRLPPETQLWLLVSVSFIPPW